MTSRTPIQLRAELGATLKLAGPIVLSQVAHMSMGMVDTLVAGRISTTALAGLGLAGNFFWTFSSVFVGGLYALDTYFSQAVGARDDQSLAKYLGQSFWSACFLTVTAALFNLVAYWVYLAVADPGPMRAAVTGYLEVVLWCLPAMFGWVVLQRYWQARHRVVPIMIIIIAANVLNLVGNFALGMGYWGFPRMEVRGLALATVVCRYGMLAAMLAYTWYQLKPRSFRPVPLNGRVQRDLARLGAPAAGHTALEISAFSIATFIVGALGAVPLAAHHVCLMMAAFTFMFPLGFSAAAAVRVGMFVGAKEPDRARVAGWLCIGASVAVMFCFALGYLVFPRTLLGWFTKDPAVVNTGVKILALVALFQIADGIQVSTTGALRGLGNTRAAMMANLVGHYPIGLALGLLLCFGLRQGVVGMWAGLAAGLISVAAILLRVWAGMSRNAAAIRPLVAVNEAV